MNSAGAQLVRGLSAAIAVVMANLSATEGSIHATAGVNFKKLFFRVSSLFNMVCLVTVCSGG